MGSRRVLCASLLVAALAVSLIGDVSSQIVSTADRPDHGRHKGRTASHKKGHDHSRRSRGSPECPKGYFSNDDRCESCSSYSDKYGKQHADCEEPVHTHDPPADPHPTKAGRHEPRDPPCGIGSYRPGLGKACVQCPFPKTTLRVGANSEDDCVCGSGSGKGANCDECPTDTTLLDSGVCGCMPGHGGVNCEQCKAGTFSTGGQATNPRAPCQLCGLRLTSPPGSPAADFCECEAGFGADNTTLPMEERACVPCKHGSFNVGPARSADDAAYFSIQSLQPAGGRAFTGSPQILACSSCDERNPDGGFTTLYAGAKAASACLCKPGHGGLDCTACAEGSFSGGGKDAVCTSCPSNGAGFTTVPAIAATSISSCVCMPGYGLTDDGQCRMCEANSYSAGGSKQQCQICPFGTASRPGATSYWECKGDVAQKCPAGQWVPEDAVSTKQCRCLPGYGGGATADAPCTICPVGTFSPGGSLDGCLPCAFGTTSKPGARSADECSSNRIEQPCPVGQVAPPDAVSAAQCGCMAGFGGTSKPTDPCTLCAPGTWSAGATTQPCEPCGVGFTSPAGATAADQCYAANACPAGTQFPDGRKQHASVDECVCKPGYGSATGQAPCSLCPANTFSTGGTLEGCRPCAFGTTSNAGSTSEQACYSIEACPAGTEVHRSIQFPSSQADCVCKPGFGTDDGKAPCSLCKAGTFSHGGSLEACKPCGFGKTSAEGALDETQCVDVAQACPPGQEAPLGAVSRDQCQCKAGFGTGATPNDPCTPCSAGMYADDGVCVPCAFGTTSGPGAASWTECRPAAQSCPIGQFAPEGAKSAAECRCFPGFGDTTSRDAPCTLCAAGTYSANKGTEACLPCDFGFTSPEGSDAKSDCHPVDECPAGTALFLAEGEVPSGPVDCRCRPGYGSVTGQVGAPCRRCAVGSWSAGATNDDCTPCRFGKTSQAGATQESDCVDLRAACPYGKIAPPNAASGDECTCMPGYGISKDGTCELCSPGSWAAGGANTPCVSCPHGHSSPLGAQSAEQCVPANACPAGTLYVDGGEQPFSLKSSCVCKPGYGTQDGGLCRLCSPGTWAAGGSADACRACGKGWTSEQGAISVHECFQEFELVPPKYVPTQQGARDVINIINTPNGQQPGSNPINDKLAGTAPGKLLHLRPGSAGPMQPGRPLRRAVPSQLGGGARPPPQRPMDPSRIQHVGPPRVEYVGTRMNTMRDVEMQAKSFFHGPRANAPFMPTPAQAQQQAQTAPKAEQPAPQQQQVAAPKAAQPAPQQQPAAAKTEQPAQQQQPAAAKTEQPAQQQPAAAKTEQPAAPKAGIV